MQTNRERELDAIEFIHDRTYNLMEEVLDELDRRGMWRFKGDREKFPAVYEILDGLDALREQMALQLPEEQEAA